MIQNNTDQKYLTRSQTKNINQIITIHSKYSKKYQGNSQFIRSKFDIDYYPKFRVIKSGISITKQNKLARNKQFIAKFDQLSHLYAKTHQEIKSGKKIIIDWSQHDQFRITKFPNLNLNSQRSKTIKSKHTTDDFHDYQLTKRSQNFSKILQNPANKEITSKSQHLRELLLQSINVKKRSYGKKPKKLRYYSQMSQSLNSPQASQLNTITTTNQKDSHYNYSIEQQIQQKKKQFFVKNSQKIKQALHYQKQMDMLLYQQSHPSPTIKHKIQQIQSKILCKSKLTLLKCDLARKFKQIKQGILDNTIRINYHPK